MNAIDPGHKYQVVSYDGYSLLRITFMKREGEGYPGNVGHHPGTNCQELLRVLIDRVQYLNNQISHDNNLAIIRKLQECLWLFEDRAAQRHGISQFDFRPDDICDAPTCSKCGHVVCKCFSK